MCHYLNVQFQGQRVKRRDKLIELDFEVRIVLKLITYKKVLKLEMV